MAKQYKSAAALTIREASKMTPKGRKDIAAWLRQQAKNLEELGTDYGPRFRASFRYQES